MALNSDIAYKFGCGRYIQEQGAIEKNLAVEIKRHGKKPLFVCGKNGYKAAWDKIESALCADGINYELTLFSSTPCLENADELAENAREKNCDIICGVGGGVVGDTAKLVASRADLPLIQIPTSSATCVAATPLSVMYDRNTHAHLGSLKLMKEASAVLVDLDVMIEQPTRLFWAGVMDSKAKMVEITHRVKAMTPETTPVGFDMAFVISKEVYDFYTQKYGEIARALSEKKINKDFELAVFYAIAVTGIISGISKGSNQCALAHRFYEETRSYFYEEAKDFVHGELVAMGLILQEAYNGGNAVEMRDTLKNMGLPTLLSEINIPATEKNINLYIDLLCASSAVKDESEQSKSKMRVAFLEIAG